MPDCCTSIKVYVDFRDSFAHILNGLGSGEKVKKKFNNLPQIFDNRQHYSLKTLDWSDNYPPATPQCPEALCAATSKRDKPIIATEGPIVKGVIHLIIKLSKP